MELWFDFSCPYAYLASRKAPALAARLGRELDWRPMLLGGVFRGIGAGDGPMATLSAAKAKHNAEDMLRWAEVLEVPLRIPAAHPMRTVRALRVLLTLPRREWPAAIAALYATYWERNEDITQDAVIDAALRAVGIVADFARADSDAVKDDLRSRTDEAIAKGIFGAPAWVIDGVLLWGQDRMEWVEAIANGWKPDSDVRAPIRAAAPASSRRLDMYFDVSSPFAYLALTQLPRLHAAPVMHPILLGALFRDIGQANVPLFTMPAPKLRYLSLEMQRWARWWGVPFDMPRKFPQRTIAAQRLALVAGEHCLKLATALGRAMWAEQRDLEDETTLREILDREGFPVEWLARTQDPAVKAQLAAETAAAKDANVFGVPTFIVDGKHLFWGQDRLDHVSRWLR